MEAMGTMQGSQWLCGLLLLWGCANPLPPPGGPPDREPPRVIAVEPPSGSTGVRKPVVRFTFSEFVEKASVLQALRVQPPVPWRAVWNWWGTAVELHFLQPLDSHTTYVVTLGSEYRDLAGNTAAEATSVVFSTGDRIERGRLEGRLLDPQPAGVFMWAYPLDGLRPDTLNPAHTPPRYWTQVGSAGTFALQGLAEGEYRVFAVRDVDRNGLYTEGVDALGTTMFPVVVRADSPAVVVLRLGEVADTTPPKIVDVRPQSRQRVRVLFSEPLDTLSIQPSAVSVVDTASGDVLPLLAAYLVPGTATTVELMTAHPVDTLTVYVLQLQERGFRDTAGNAVRAGEHMWRFRFRGMLDTAPVRWVQIVPADSMRSYSSRQPVELIAEAPLDSAAADVEVFDAAGRPVPIRWEIRAAQHWRITPLTRWESGQWYRLRVHFQTAQLPGGRLLADTLIVRHFQAVDTRQYADLTGQIQDSLGCRGEYIVLLRSLSGEGLWRQRLSQPGQWRFSEIPPGTYEVEAFCDEDGNGRYSAGGAFPYRFAERFTRVGPLELKPRWSIEGVLVQLP